MYKVLVAAAAALILSACGSHPKGPGCKADKDCKAPLVCGDNQCVECNDDSQCSGGKRCVSHACVVKPQCSSDTDCSAGQVCKDGTCQACVADGDCGPGGTCQAGACQKAKKCSKGDDCADDEDCVNGYCLKANRSTTPGTPTCSLQTVYFAFDKSEILPTERDHLDQNAQCIAQNKTKMVYLIGHTDSSGTEEYNIALSERRAQSVADYLSRLGTDPARMQVVPKGETEPTGLGDDKDRRVEFQWH